ncbi:MAG TPA: creatininase family protein [Armatimonadota bacterium]|nr:creatininase family protein [Armatimonadota bacterium]HQK94882.1 creatininase family protein [Armatimonadota bacterium]
MRNSMLFRDQTSPIIGEHARRGSLLILPIGTTEEHGPHLPVDTDARIAEAYGARLAEAVATDLPVLVLDTIRYGYSMQIMRRWPGTIVVRSRVFMDLVFDVVRSTLDMGFRKLVILDCHGHHSGPLNTVSREICDACHKSIAIISPAVLSRDEFNQVRKSGQGGAIHGGEWETSLLLHISPEVVDMSLAPSGDAMRYHSDFVAGDGFMGRQRVTWSTWYLQESQSGVYGDPTPATAETGRVIMDAAVANGSRFLREFWRQPDAVCRCPQDGPNPGP